MQALRRHYPHSPRRSMGKGPPYDVTIKVASKSIGSPLTPLIVSRSPTAALKPARKMPPLQA